MNQFLIPANSKRSMLILGFFKPIDLIILGIGLSITVIFALIIGANDLSDSLLILAPFIISGIMVAPVPNQRNVWTFTVNVYNYFSNRRSYYWKGWCVIHGENGKEDK